jgi:tetratricopeptide (TPR) repeat protein
MGKPSEAEAEARKSLALLQKLADDNPADIGVRRDLGNSHNTLGRKLLQPGKSTKAEAEFRAAVAILRKVVDDDPKVLMHREFLAAALMSLGCAHLKLGRPAEALDDNEQAFTLLEQLIKEDPTGQVYRQNKGSSLIGRGLARRALGNPAGAAADVRQALSLSQGLPMQRVGVILVIACSHAALAGLAGREGAGVAAAEGKAHADQAMALLRKPVDEGYRSLDWFRTEEALDSLRNRSDFQLLMMDLEFPAAPFAE